MIHNEPSPYSCQMLRQNERSCFSDIRFYSMMWTLTTKVWHRRFCSVRFEFHSRRISTNDFSVRRVSGSCRLVLRVNWSLELTASLSLCMARWQTDSLSDARATAKHGVFGRRRSFSHILFSFAPRGLTCCSGWWLQWQCSLLKAGIVDKPPGRLIAFELTQRFLNIMATLSLQVNHGPCWLAWSEGCATWRTEWTLAITW